MLFARLFHLFDNSTRGTLINYPFGSWKKNMRYQEKLIVTWCMKFISLPKRLLLNECRIWFWSDSSKIDNDIKLIRNKNSPQFFCKILHKIINFRNGVGTKLNIAYNIFYLFLHTEFPVDILKLLGNLGYICFISHK